MFKMVRKKKIGRVESNAKKLDIEDWSSDKNLDESALHSFQKFQEVFFHCFYHKKIERSCIPRPNK